VVDALFNPEADLDESVELELEGLESLEPLSQVQDPYLAFDMLGDQNPYFPSWLPESYEGRKLTFSERREWFDGLMRHYGAYSNDSQLPDDPSSRQRLAVLSLLLMYQARIMGALPAPSFTRRDDY